MKVPEALPGQDRIGVSVEVPEPFSSQLRRARESFGDAHANTVPAHITILPPTAIAQSAMDEVMTHLGEVGGAMPPFTIHLRGTGTFRPVSPVVFLQVVQGISACEQLESAVRSGALAQELRFNYHPHVTIAHEVPDEALDRAFTEFSSFDEAFFVRAMHLYRYGDDGVWRPVHQFALTGG